MTIAPDLVAQILRLYTVEKWRVGTIARQLHVHGDVVRRVLAVNAALGHPWQPPTTPLRPSRIDPYRPFLLATLSKYPTLTAARLHAMVTERGYVGSTSHFRALVAGLRPRPSAEAFLRLRTLPGEQAQVDWGHFGHLQIGRARRPLMAFVMVLSHSRMIFLRFFLDARMDSFLRGHVEAFIAFNGCPRVVLYDNLKSAVLERVGDAIRFNPELLALAGHFLFEPRPVAVARGNEKECGSCCLLWVTWCCGFAQRLWTVGLSAAERLFPGRPGDRGSGCRRSSRGPNASTACSSWTCPGVIRRTRSGASTRGTTDWTRSSPGQMTPTGPVPKSSLAAGWRRSWTCRSFRPPRTSYPWL